MSENEEYDLAKSSKKLGKLYPILKDKKGNIIDGFHRQNADPDWPSITVDTVDDPIKLELARLAVNYCRRAIPKTEFDNHIAFLVKNGLKPEEIAEETGIHISTIFRHMPQELKPKGEAISEGMEKASELARASSSITIQETKELKGLCQVCNTYGTVKPWVYEGKELLLDEVHYADAVLDPLKYRRFFEGYEKKLLGKKVPDDQLSNLISCGQCGRPVGIMNAKNYDDKDLCPSCYDKAVHTKEFREARMHPGVSKFEDEVALDLQAHKIPIGLRNEPITLPFPFGDFNWYLPKGILALRLNGEVVHRKRNSKDEAIVFALETLGVRVISYTYKSGSEKEKAEVRELVSEKLKELGWNG
jgi:hypothetical protein